MRNNILFIVMSVGKYCNNATAKYLYSIGGREQTIVVLPRVYKENAKSYQDVGFEVYIYDEKRYINNDFEFFGFAPRNCGGIGRQGVAEFVSKHTKMTFVVFDDDYTGIYIQKQGGNWVCIRKIENLLRLYALFCDFSEKTNIGLCCQYGMQQTDKFMANNKQTNNYIITNEDINYWGFAALCADDFRFAIYRSLINAAPFITAKQCKMMCKQKQGDRKDGNAPIYNRYHSWNKSFLFKMMFPWAVTQRVAKENGKLLFREGLRASNIYPPILLETDRGELVKLSVIK